MAFTFSCDHCGKSHTRKERPNGRKNYCSPECRMTPRSGIPNADGTILVPLSRGKFAKIDAEDAPKILKNCWTFDHGYAKRYPRRNEQSSVKTIYMHREILEAPAGFVVDHIDGDKLNNTRSNLRIATYSENGANSKLRSTNTSGFRGVSFVQSKSKWVAVIVVDLKAIWLGDFDDAVEAAQAYDVAAIDRFGEFARTNFPRLPQ